MKKRILFIALVSVWLSGNVFASWPRIDSLRIIPATPNSNDSVQLIAYSAYPCMLCFMLNSEVGISGTVVSITVSHLYGINCYPVSCYPVDTIPLGILDAEDYTLHFQLVCDTNTAIIYDHDSLYFTVHQQTGLKYGIKQPQLNIEPNPAKEYFILKLPDRLTGSYTDVLLQVFDLQGRLHYIQRQNLENNRLQVNTAHWPEGLYMLRLFIDGALPLRAKVMVIN